MFDSEQRPTPKPPAGRLFWIAGLALGVIAGALVALELTMIGG